MKAKLLNMWKSWTIVFNAACATVLGILPMAQDSLPAFQQYVPDIKWAAVLVIVGNIVLRFKTSTGLQNK